MKQPIIFSMFFLVAAACNNPGDKINTGTAGADSTVSDQATAAPATSSDSSFAGCYAYEGGRDTVLLQLENKDGSLSGALSYNYFEKDRNDGTLQATATGDRITGYYLFKSEGVMSVRQEIWKITDGRLIPGTGEMMQRNDSMFFKDPATVKFDESRALTKRACVI